jgi:hypothetical protein
MFIQPTQQSLRGALELCERWMQQAREHPSKFSKSSHVFLPQRHKDLLNQLLNLQLKEFDRS